MSTHYVAMVRETPTCRFCGGTGYDPDEDVGAFHCERCDGTGHLPERLVLHRDGKLYDEPGKASGSAKRAGLDPVVLKIDTDELHPVDHRMSLDEKIGHAEAKYTYWGGRLDALQKEAAGLPVLYRHDPQLTAEDWRELCVLVANALDHFERGDWAPPTRIARRRHVESILERLKTKVHLDQMDAEHLESRAEIDRMHADWAAGKGPRKCLRVGEVNPLDNTARTACGDTVPALASTTDRAEVACCGCER